jgi:rare lipoprotein A
VSVKCPWLPIVTVYGVLCAAIGPSEAKIPGAVHCYNDICHRVRTIGETERRLGIVESVIASFYDAPDRDRFNPRQETSSGELFAADADDNAASPIHPDGTILLLWSPTTHAAVVVRVNNAGPYFPGRSLDVSRGVAERMGFGGDGLMTLLSVVIAAPQQADAAYVRARVYPKVPGYFGTFASLDMARQGAQGFAPEIEIGHLQVVAASLLVSKVSTGTIFQQAATNPSAKPSKSLRVQIADERKTHSLPSVEHQDVWQASIFAGSGR